MSKKAREATLDTFKHKDKVIAATHLHSIDRELTLFEIAQMTRSGPAKCLGLGNLYGGLAPGMIADVGVFDLNCKNMPGDAEKIESAFQRAACFIKSGEIVVKDGDVLGHGHKKTVWVNVNMPENPQVKRDIAQSFTKDYTVQLENYSVKDYLAPHPFVINVDVEA
jgi:formylmethanofuran dehydrogenase subunit A